jgi:predicted  nucleic acid-binding Zn-ribbon protein
MLKLFNSEKVEDMHIPAIAYVDPRVRMKEIRKLVSKKIDKQERVDMLALSIEDKDRALVALQDLLETEKSRHAKARKHIMAEKELTAFLAFNAATTLESLINLYNATESKLSNLNKNYEKLSKQNVELAAFHEKGMSDNYNLKIKLEASLTTLNTVMSRQHA